MSTTRTTKNVADWLVAHPAPIHRSGPPAWSDRVEAELGVEAFEELLVLLAEGDLEEQYQPVAAARALGAEVWAGGEEPNAVWLVDLPHDEHRRTICPGPQLAG